MRGIIYTDEALADIQSNAIDEALTGMPDSVEPKYTTGSYTYKVYHPTEDKLCLPIELGRFVEWDIYINSVLTGDIVEISNDWQGTI